MQTVTPLDPAQRALAESTSEALFDAAMRLTHKIHGTTDPVRKQELRVQRGLLRGELLARIPAGAR